jgi:FAD:protein FMN transferase
MNRDEVQRECQAMGTQFDVILRGDDNDHLVAVAVAVCEEFQRLDASLSRFNPSSEIARINREAHCKPLRIDRELFALLTCCDQAREQTKGYFDVTATTGGNGFVLDADRCTIQFTRPDVTIDLGAIGKGYALDCGREIVTRFGIASALLNGGTSSVLAIGNDAWPIYVRHPLAPENIVQRVMLTNRALSCSAVRHPTQMESDIVNPLDGTPLLGDDACVVLAASAVEAEIFSTALLAMGQQNAAIYLANVHCADLQVKWF